MALFPADKENMLDVLVKFPEQCKKASILGKNIKINTPDFIFVCGMGGSGISGDILKAYLGSMMKMPPVIVVKDYTLPYYATRNSLVFAVSYSGNTEETLSCFRSALAKQCNMIAISSGGKLKQLCAASAVPFIHIPEGLQPRNAFGYLFIPMLNVLATNNIMPSQQDAISRMTLALNNKAIFEKAKELSEKLVNKIPIIYSSEKLSVVAYRWKCEFNENSKIMAFNHTFSELNHNEIVGYTNLKADFFVIMIEDESDIPKIKKRMDITKRLIIEKGVPCLTLKMTGNDLLTRIFNAMYLGDITSYFLAMKYGIDPTPVKIVEDLKKNLS